MQKTGSTIGEDRFAEREIGDCLAAGKPLARLSKTRLDVLDAHRMKRQPQIVLVLGVSSNYA